MLLIGYRNEQGASETKGTGFVVSSKEEEFLVTCRHVVENLPPEQVFAIPRPKEYVLPRGRHDLVKLGRPFFHSMDDEFRSCDVAAYKLGREESLSQEAAELIRLDALSSEPFIQEGTEVLVLGYSVQYLSSHFNFDSPRLLAPEKRKGVVKTVPLGNLRQGGFTRAPVHFQFMQATDGVAIGSGMSGGAVMRVSDGQCVGMLVASVSGSWTLPSGVVVRANGGAFIPALYIKQTIERA